jgi:hypothetical protein
MSKGALTGPVQLKPTLLCTGDSTDSSSLWRKFGWGSQIFEVDSTTPDGFKGAVDNAGNPIYISDVIPPDEKRMPWFLVPKLYYTIESTDYETDLCVAPKGRKALAITMQGSPGETFTVDTTNVQLATTEQIILFCSGLSDTKTKRLTDVVGRQPEPYFETQIAEVIAEVSLTVFHEFLHLVTNWESNPVLGHTC